MHLFGIGQTQKPYPTNDASAVKELHIYKAYLHSSLNFEHRDYFPFFTSLNFRCEASFFPLFTHMFSLQFTASFISNLICFFGFYFFNLVDRQSLTDEAFVWDRVGICALSYKRCVSCCGGSYIYIRPFCQFFCLAADRRIPLSARR